MRGLAADLLRLLVGGIAFIVGMAVGGMLATLLRLTAPTPPAGMDAASAGASLVLMSPLVALAPVLLARRLGGRFWTRAAVLAFFIWIVYTVNTQLEASIFSSLATGMPFTLVTFAVPSILSGLAVAWLFPPRKKVEETELPPRDRHPVDWAWRLALAAVAFMPVYWFFGTLVVPFTAEYYRQSQFGLSMPSVDQILTILFVRSILFLLACLPVVVLWQSSRRELFWRLGAALFILVGLVYMIAADWMPVYVRLPHAIEIMADEFVYAGLLVLLLAKAKRAEQHMPTVAQQHASS